ncbi:MAG: AraC family transcriptional regulator [Clostridia bacterium]|nr:AraC family transcriptional regulator [Clostridia bacterium]
MGQQQPLNAQCFVKKAFLPLFSKKNDPQLLYVCKISPDVSNRHPRIMHSHDDLVELVLIYSGASEYLIHDKKYAVKAGDLLVYNSNVVHDENSTPDSELGFFTIAVGDLNMLDLRPNALIPDDAGYLFPTGHHFEELRQLFEMMFRNLSEGEPYAERFCNSLMHALLDRVLCIVNAPTPGIAPEMPEVDEPNILGSRVKKYIDQHYTEPITLQSMATDLHASPCYLSHVFKDMSGYSPIQYLLRRRIGEAQTLLITTDYPVTQIAGMVGYDTQSYFNMQFTKNVGISPKKFRQNYIVAEKEIKPAVKRKPKKKSK